MGLTAPCPGPQLLRRLLPQHRSLCLNTAWPISYASCHYLYWIKPKRAPTKYFKNLIISDQSQLTSLCFEPQPNYIYICFSNSVYTFIQSNIQSVTLSDLSQFNPLTPPFPLVTQLHLCYLKRLLQTLTNFNRSTSVAIIFIWSFLLFLGSEIHSYCIIGTDRQTDRKTDRKADRQTVKRGWGVEPGCEKQGLLMFMLLLLRHQGSSEERTPVEQSWGENKTTQIQILYSTTEQQSMCSACPL